MILVIILLEISGLFGLIGISEGKLIPSFFSSSNTQDAQKKIERVNTLNPVLRWFSVSGSKKYQLIIREFEENKITSKATIIRTFELVDTFFVIPDLLLENGKLYGWNVRAFDGKEWSKPGDEFYFIVDLKASKTTKSELATAPLKPGKHYPEIEILDGLHPKFVWTGYDKEHRFELNIEKLEKDNLFKIVFTTEGSELLKDTFYTLKKNLLIPDVVYRWNVKTINSSGEIFSSDYKYFKVVLPEKNVTLKILYPGFKDEGLEIIGTKTPTFVWEKLSSADFYSIYLYKKEEDGNYKLIFNSKDKIAIKDTTFVLPENILDNNQNYKWTITATLKSGKVVQSNALYFKVLVPEPRITEVPKPKVEDESITEEILLNMEYAGILKTFITSIYSNDKIFVSIREFLNNLQIPYDYDAKTIKIKSDDKEFFIDFSKGELKFENRNFVLGEDDFIYYDDEHYFSINLVEKILALKIELDFSTLTLRVSSERPLPVYAKYLIEQRYASLKKFDREKSLPLLFGRQRSLLNGLVLDYSLSQTIIRNQRSGYSYTTAIGGELLYGDFYYQRQEFRTLNFTSKVENYNWKFTPNPNKYLTQISIGDDYVDGINAYSFRGINLTNEVVEPRKKIGNYIYQGKSEPNSLIEIYLGNELIGITRANEDGDYQFEIPLRYGMSNFEIRTHTIKGETKISRKIFQVPYDLLPKGIFNYRLTGGKMKFTNYDLGLIEVSYGLSDFLTLSTGGEYVNERSNKHFNLFIKPSMRIFSNIFISGFYSPKLFSSIQGSLVQPDYTSYIFEFIKFRKNNFYNPSNQLSSFRGNFYLPIKISHGELGFYSRQEYNSFALSKRYLLGFNSYYFYRWLGLNFGIYGENTHTTILMKRRELNFGTTLNFNNLLKNIPVLNRSYLSLRANYNLIDDKFDNFSVFTTSNLLKNLRLQINYDRLFNLRSSNFSLNLFYEIPQTRYNMNTNAKDVVNHQISGSVGYIPQINSVYFYSEPQIGRASLFITGFEDKNGNSSQDFDEREIRGIDFSINSASYSHKLKDGKLFLGLNPYQEYTIKLIETNLLTPNYSFELQEFNLRTDGNKTKVVKLPFYETGEIGGIVVRKFEKEELPLTNVRLIIKNVYDEKEIQIVTFSDGSFYHYGLRKGKYLIKIDESYLQRTGLKSKPENIEIEIDPTKNQLIFENLKFVLE